MTMLMIAITMTFFKRHGRTHPRQQGRQEEVLVLGVGKVDRRDEHGSGLRDKAPPTGLVGGVGIDGGASGGNNGRTPDATGGNGGGVSS